MVSRLLDIFGSLVVLMACGPDGLAAMERVDFNGLLAATGGRPSAEAALSIEFDRISTDSRTVRAGDLFWALRGPHFDGQDFVREAAQRGAAACVVRADRFSTHSLPALIVDDTHEALRDFASWHRRRTDALVVGITGSVGKTTTREMIYSTLSAGLDGCRTPRNFNNDVGLPLSVLAIERGHDFAVLEMGASQRGDIRRLCDVARPDMGVVTRIGPAHLDSFGSLDAILKTKSELIESLPSGGVAVVNGDDPLCRSLARRAGCRVVEVGQKIGNTIRATSIESTAEALRFTVDGHAYRVRAAGGHNLGGALAAIAIGRELGMTPAVIAAGLDRFAPVDGRCQVKQLDGLTVIDDTYNANPSSVEAACELLSEWKVAGRRILVLGHMAELGHESSKSHEAVGRLAAAAGVDFVAAYGPNADDVLRGALGQGMSPACVSESHDLASLQAVLECWLEPGDVVLVKGSRCLRMERVTEWLEQRNSKETLCPRGDTRAYA